MRKLAHSQRQLVLSALILAVSGLVLTGLIHAPLAHAATLYENTFNGTSLSDWTNEVGNNSQCSTSTGSLLSGASNTCILALNFTFDTLRCVSADIDTTNNARVDYFLQTLGDFNNHAGNWSLSFEPNDGNRDISILDPGHGYSISSQVRTPTGEHTYAFCQDTASNTYTGYVDGSLVLTYTAPSSLGNLVSLRLGQNVGGPGNDPLNNLVISDIQIPFTTPTPTPPLPVPSVLYANDFTSSVADFTQFFGTCTPSPQGINCPAGSLYKHLLDDLVCVSAEFTNPASVNDQLFITDDNYTWIQNQVGIQVNHNGYMSISSTTHGFVYSSIPAQSGTHTYMLCRSGDTFTGYVDGASQVSLTESGHAGVGFAVGGGGDAYITNLLVTNYVPNAAHQPPAVSPLSGATVTEGASYSESGSFTDPGASSWTATVDYGDGSGVQPLALSGMTFTLSHVYASPGAYTVTVAVIDDQSATGTATGLVTVDAPPAITSAAAVSTGMRVPLSFTVTTSGAPVPSVSESGTLPTGATFTDNGDGTATLGGEAVAGTAGTYNLTITANNGVGSPATQSFTLTVTAATSAPVITSATSDTETYGVPFTFTVTTDGYPTPVLTKSGTLPSGLSFADNGDGTATLGGTPSAAAAGVYSLTFKAKSATGTATQGFTLTIVKGPVFKAVTIPVAHVGSNYSLTLKTSSYSTATMTESGALPAGLSFTDNGDGSATITGTPQLGSGGAYPITVYATNQVGSSSKSITIKVNEAPAITSASGASATVGQAFSFAVTTTGYPTPSLSKSGTLPRGLTYHSATHSIDGTPAAGSQGTYVLVFTAKNSSGTVQQSFTLTVS